MPEKWREMQVWKKEIVLLRINVETILPCEVVGAINIKQKNG
jgi:hypothetical protein